MIMVCCLDSEMYSSALFHFCLSVEEAKKWIEDKCSREGFFTKWETDDRCYADKVSNNFYNDDDWSWYVFQCFTVSDDYIVVYHHAYDGIDFDIVGGFNNFYKAKDAMVMELFDHYKTCDENKRIFEWLDECSAGIDTGEQWEVWTIVKVPMEIEKNEKR